MTISKYLAEQKSEFLFIDIEYYPFFKYYTSEFVIHNWLSALAVTVMYTSVFAQFWIVLLSLYRGFMDMGYLPFYFQGYGILCTFSGILQIKKRKQFQSENVL